VLIVLARAVDGEPVCFWLLPWLHDLYEAERIVALAQCRPPEQLVPRIEPPEPG
jgi:hypothetical protein